MAIGEGGPELARQLLSKTYNIPYPKVIAIYLTGTPIPGVGPQDVALELIRSTFKDGVVKNAVMEFFGPGVANLSMDYRSGIDVMTTETTCLSSIWPADHTLKAHLAVLGRGEAFKPQAPADGAYYDGLIEVELDKIRPMIALPFHPSNAYTIQEFQENLDELLHQVDEDTVRQLKLKNRPASLREKIVDGKFRVDQGSHRRLLRRYLPEYRAGGPDPGRPRHRLRRVLAVGLSHQPARQPGADPEGLYRLPHGRRRLYPLLLLRPLLRRGRRARQRGFLHPSLHP